ncbi:MAG: hypothetical protein ACTHK6_01855 [Solirubrobacterales bacterium]
MKLLLIPLAIVAFVIFLLVLGAIGLGVAFAVLYVCNRIWRLITAARPSRRRRAREQSV